MKKIFQPLKSDKGVVLITVLIFAVLIMIIAAAVINTITSQARLTEHQVRRVTAMYTAESGLYYAREKLSKGDTFTGEHVQISQSNDQEVDVSVVDNGGGVFTLTSVADYAR